MIFQILFSFLIRIFMLLCPKRRDDEDRHDGNRSNPEGRDGLK